MPTFQIFPDATHQAGDTRSQSTVIPDIRAVRFYLTGTFNLADEPASTTIVWSIDRSPDGGNIWLPMVRAAMKGNDGTPFIRPPAIFVTVDGVVGQMISGYLTLSTALKFGVEAETF